MLLGSWCGFTFFGISFSCPLEESEPDYFLPNGMGKSWRGEVWRGLLLGCPKDGGDQNFKGYFQIPQYNQRKRNQPLKWRTFSYLYLGPHFNFISFHQLLPIDVALKWKQSGKVGLRPIQERVLGRVPFQRIALHSCGDSFSETKSLGKVNKVEIWTIYLPFKEKIYSKRLRCSVSCFLGLGCGERFGQTYFHFLVHRN